MLTWFLTKLQDNIAKASINYFATYYLYYKEKLRMIEFAHNSFLF